MSKNSYKIIDIPLYVWLIVAIIMALSIWGFIYIINNKDVTNGGYGNLIAGTIGVGSSIGAMLLILFSFGEQRKMTNQKEVQSLIERFNFRFDKFLHSLNEGSKVDVNDPKKTCHEHLHSIWGEEDDKESTSIQNGLNSIKTNRIRDDTEDRIRQIKTLCDDVDLKNTSKGLLRLYALKSQTEQLNSEDAIIIEEDLDTIPSYLKEYAGFYYGWISPEIAKLSHVRNLSIKLAYNGWFSLDKDKSEKYLLKNELIKFFYDKHERLPDFIPKIRMSVGNAEKNVNGAMPDVGEELQFLFSEDNMAKQSMVIVSNNPFKTTLNELKIATEPESKQFLKIPLRINLFPEHGKLSVKTISFRKFYGKSYKTFFGFLQGLHLDYEGKINLKLDLTMNYLGNEWIYENIMEFNLYETNKAIIIFKQFEDKQ